MSYEPPPDYDWRFILGFIILLLLIFGFVKFIVWMG